MPKRVVTSIILLILVFILINLIRQTAAALQSGQRMDQAVESLANLQQQNRILQSQLKESYGYDSVEKIARDKLDLSKLGETVVIIPQSEIDKVLAAETPPPQVKLPNWQGWMKLIFH